MYKHRSSKIKRPLTTKKILEYVFAGIGTVAIFAYIHYNNISVEDYLFDASTDWASVESRQQRIHILSMIGPEYDEPTKELVDTMFKVGPRIIESPYLLSTDSKVTQCYLNDRDDINTPRCVSTGQGEYIPVYQATEPWFFHYENRQGQKMTIQDDKRCWVTPGDLVEPILHNDRFGYKVTKYDAVDCPETAYLYWDNSILQPERKGFFDTVFELGDITKPSNKPIIKIMTRVAEDMKYIHIEPEKFKTKIHSNEHLN
jgi:hypothetical protein